MVGFLLFLFLDRKNSEPQFIVGKNYDGQVVESNSIQYSLATLVKSQIWISTTQYL